MASGEDLIELVSEPQLTYEEIIGKQVDIVWGKLQHAFEQGKSGLSINVDGRDQDIHALFDALAARDSSLKFKDFKVGVMDMILIRKMIIYREPSQDAAAAPAEGAAAEKEAPLPDSTSDQNA